MYVGLMFRKQYSVHVVRIAPPLNTVTELLIICYVFMVTHIAIVWTNRVRLPILLMVS